MKRTRLSQPVKQSKTVTRPSAKETSSSRTLVVSIGNTSLFGGVFRGHGLEKSFRVPTASLVQLLQHVPREINRAVVCSVVPAQTPDVVRFIHRTWNVEAKLLTYDAAHGLKLGYRKPAQLGADRIAVAIGAAARYPRKHVVVVDCGTATTVTALHRNGTLLGGAILPGLSLWSEMLTNRTALLPRVEPRKPGNALARTTEDAIASGVFFGHLGAIRELLLRIRTEAFGRSDVTVIGTGGLAHMFAEERLFTTIAPDLILAGLHAFANRADRP
ncbi:MAG: type III pantothenate kinase [Opitutus sp.]